MGLIAQAFVSGHRVDVNSVKDDLLFIVNELEEAVIPVKNKGQGKVISRQRYIRNWCFTSNRAAYILICMLGWEQFL